MDLTTGPFFGPILGLTHCLTIYTAFSSFTLSLFFSFLPPFTCLIDPSSSCLSFSYSYCHITVIYIGHVIVWIISFRCQSALSFPYIFLLLHPLSYCIMFLSPILPPSPVSIFRSISWEHLLLSTLVKSIPPNCISVVFLWRFVWG